jgi:dTDP-glucose 4,6-dehydratase
MTLLVTGGAGFIGSCFVRQWLDEETEPLVVLDKLTYAGNLDSLPLQMMGPLEWAGQSEGPSQTAKPLPPGKGGWYFRQGDIADRELVRELLERHAIRAIVHLAAESHVDRSIDGPIEFAQTNVLGTCELLRTALDYWERLPDTDRRSFRFLHVSTDEVYGSLGPTGRFDESSPYAPNSPYAASKAAADHFARAFQKTYGLPTIITNCSNNYGPYQFPEKLIPLMTLNALEGRSLPVYGDGGNVRDWLHVEDHCRALRLALAVGEPGEVYNLGGDCERTNLEVICRAVDALGLYLPHAPCESRIQFVPDRPGHDRRYAVDSTKAERQLGWRRRFQFSDGLAATVRWYHEQREWVERVNSGAYRRERLGLRGDL